MSTKHLKFPGINITKHACVCGICYSQKTRMNGELGEMTE